MLPSTVMRYGVNSYETEDVVIWEDDKKCGVSPNAAPRLEEEWKSVPIASLKLVTDDDGVVKTTVNDETGIAQRLWNSCSIS